MKNADDTTIGGSMSATSAAGKIDNKPPGTPIDLGRKILIAAGFGPGPNTGQGWEVWINQHGVPTGISYLGRDMSQYSTIDIEEALTQKDQKTF